MIEFRNEEIERLQERVARELGFSLVGHKLELYGVPIKRRANEAELGARAYLVAQGGKPRPIRTAATATAAR